MITTSFKELLIITSKEIYDTHGQSEEIKNKLNNFLSTIKILDSLVIKDSIGMRSIEHYEINGKYTAYTGQAVLQLPYFYNEVDDISQVPSSTISAYICSECNI